MTVYIDVALQCGYSDLRVNADRPLLYVDRLKAVVAQIVFKLFSYVQWIPN